MAQVRITHLDGTVDEITTSGNQQINVQQGDKIEVLNATLTSATVDGNNYVITLADPVSGTVEITFVDLFLLLAVGDPTQTAADATTLTIGDEEIASIGDALGQIATAAGTAAGGALGGGLGDQVRSGGSREAPGEFQAPDLGTDEAPRGPLLQDFPSDPTPVDETVTPDVEVAVINQPPTAHTFSTDAEFGTTPVFGGGTGGGDGGDGAIAYVSNGEYGDGGDSHPSWTTTDPGGDGGDHAYNAAIRNYAFNAAEGFDGNILFVSDSGNGAAIATVLSADGHTVTVALDDFSGGSNPTLLGDLSGFDAIFWSASGDSSGDEHTDTDVFANLMNFVEGGGFVFVTGYDSIASPEDPLLIEFLGGTSSYDNSSVSDVPEAATGDNALTTGVIDIQGVTPTNHDDDLDTLFTADGTQIVVSDGSGASWSLLTVEGTGGSGGGGGGDPITIDFNDAVSGDVASLIRGDVTFTPDNGGSLNFLQVTPDVNGGDGTTGGYVNGANSLVETVRADIDGGATSVSVDLGDYNADPDGVFLEIFDADDNSLGIVTFDLDASFVGMETLTIDAPGGEVIAYAVFGTTGDLGAGFVMFDNFTYTPAGGGGGGGGGGELAPELDVTTTSDGETLVNNILGSGIQIVEGSIVYNGAAVASGTFVGGEAAGIGIESGIILTSGSAESAEGPNLNDGTTTANGLPGDADLTAIAGVNTNDATILEFDFVSDGGDLFFSYVFASEEYNEYANGGVNDTFGFFVDGVNVALIPGTDTGVSINTVNGGNPYGTNAQNSEYFNNNDLQDGGPTYVIEYDGFTDVFTVSVTGLEPGEHHIKLAIADGGDSILDSGVFIQAGSFSDQPGGSGTIEGFSALFDLGGSNDAMSLGGTDPEDGLTTTYTITSLPSDGTLWADPEGDGTYQQQLQVGSVLNADGDELANNVLYVATSQPEDGQDEFTYTTTDSGGLVSSPATVTIDFGNEPPEAADDSNYGQAGMIAYGDGEGGDGEDTIIDFSGFEGAADGWVAIEGEGGAGIVGDEVLGFTPPEGTQQAFVEAFGFNGEVPLAVGLGSQLDDFFGVNVDEDALINALTGLGNGEPSIGGAALVREVTAVQSGDDLSFEYNFVVQDVTEGGTGGDFAFFAVYDSAGNLLHVEEIADVSDAVLEIDSTPEPDDGHTGYQTFNYTFDQTGDLVVVIGGLDVLGDGPDDGHASGLLIDSFQVVRAGEGGGDQSAMLDDQVVASGNVLDTIDHGSIEKFGGEITIDLADNADFDDDPASLSVTHIASETDGVGQDVVGDTVIDGQYGTLTIHADGSYSYEIDENAETNGGPDTVANLADGEVLSDTDDFTYTVSDGDFDDTATLSIHIMGANDGPTASDDGNFAVAGGSPEAGADGTDDNVLLDISHPGIDKNNDSIDDGLADNADTDPDNGDSLTVTHVTSETDLVGEAVPSNNDDTTIDGDYGTLTIHADGSYSYEVDAENGTVVALADGEVLSDTDDFVYTVTDEAGVKTDTAALSITIVGGQGGSVARDDSNAVDAVATGTATDATGNVLGTESGPDGDGNFSYADISHGADGLDDADSDPDGDQLTVTGHTGGDVYGTLTLGADGAYTYDLDEGDGAVIALDGTETLTETYTYTIDDGFGGTDTADLVITIRGTNDDPVADDDTNAVDAVATGTATNAIGNVLGTESGPDGDGNFSYADISHGADGTDDADSDIDGDQLTVTGHTGGDVHGTLTLNADGSYTYDLDEADTVVGALDGTETLTETYTYTMSDGNGGTDTADLVITINGTNDDPVADNDSNAVDAVPTGTATDATGNVLGTESGPDGDGNFSYADISHGADGTDDADSDIDGDQLTVTGHTGGDVYGTLTLNADGSYSYDLDETNAAVIAKDDSETLTETYTYTISDGNGGTDTADLVITINGVNDAPIAAPDQNLWVPSAFDDQAPEYSSPGGYPILIPLPTDPDGEALTVTFLGVSDGSLDGQVGYYDGGFNAIIDGVVYDAAILDDLVYIPTATGDPLDDFDDQSFTYTVSDGDQTDSSTVTLHEVQHNDEPGLQALIGNGSSPLTSGNDQEGDVFLSQAFIDTLTGNGGTATFTLLTDFQKAPFPNSNPVDATKLGYVPTDEGGLFDLGGGNFGYDTDGDGVADNSFTAAAAPDNTHPAVDRETEVSVTMTIMLASATLTGTANDGTYDAIFSLVEEDDTDADGVPDNLDVTWVYDDTTGLMKAVVDFGDAVLVDGSGNVLLGIDSTPISLTEYLNASTPTNGVDNDGYVATDGDQWQFIYFDNDGGSYQARFVSIDMTFDNPGDLGITVEGTEFVDVIYGTPDAGDSLNGLGGNDIIFGRGGNDTIDGGAGDDVINGGAGDDQLTGGTGLDSFVYDGSSDTAGSIDDILDFSTTDDSFVFEDLGVDATPGDVAIIDLGGNDALQINGTDTVADLNVAFGTLSIDNVVVDGTTTTVTLV